MRDKQPEVTEEQKDADGFDAAMLQSLLCAKWVAEPVIVSAGVRPYPE